jgi:hypothetical protein
MGYVSVKSSLIGSCARLESSANSVVVKTLVIASAGLSLAKGVFDRDSKPTFSVAVDETKRRSWRFGGKSLSLRTVWWGTLSDIKGSTGSLSF